MLIYTKVDQSETRTLELAMPFNYETGSVVKSFIQLAPVCSYFNVIRNF